MKNTITRSVLIRFQVYNVVDGIHPLASVV